MIAIVDDSLVIDNKANTISLKFKVFAGTFEPQKTEMTLDVNGQIKSASEQVMDQWMLFLNMLKIYTS